MTLPTYITFVRIAITPLMVVLFYVYPDNPLPAGLVFLAAGITDWLDGYLARHLRQGSRFGAFLDPVADKMIVICSLIMIASRVQDIVVLSLVMILAMREIAVSALREWMAKSGQSYRLNVILVSKCKTFFQFLTILSIIIFGLDLPPMLALVQYTLILVTLLLSLYSFSVYLIAAWPYLNTDLER